MKPTLNLASRRYVNRRASNRIFTALILLFTVFAALQAQFFLQGRKQLDKFQENIVELEEQLNGINGNAPHLSNEQIDQQKLEFAQADMLLQRDAFRWTALFDRMEKHLPSGVSISSFQPDYSKKSLSLNGAAKRLKDLQRLLDRLLLEPYDQVFLKSHGRAEVDDGMGGKKTAIKFSLVIEGVF